jgi:ubiquinone/menaquinone biosynthesis C-methylase UbiE
MLKKFISLNKTVCKKLRDQLPEAKTSIFELNEKVVKDYLNLKRDQFIVDVGGEKHCPFAEHKDPTQNAKIIAVALSEKQVKENHDADEKLIANIMQPLPFKDHRIDLVVSRAVYEHLEELEAFPWESTRVLKANGYYIHVFSSKFASFAIINQLPPRTLSKKLLLYVHPEVKGFSGFPAYYNKCFYSSIKTLFQKHGYERVEIRLNYFQTLYFSFFGPFFVMMAIYGMLLQCIRAKNLFASKLIVAKKI